MTTVKLNDIEINNWVDYIRTKFADNYHYDIEPDNSGYKIKSKTNKTYIWFDIGEDPKTLYDCQYFNDDCKGWSGETIGGANEWGFSQDYVDALNYVLEVPINNGWLAVDYYINNKLLQSKTYSRDKSSTIFVHYHGGCFGFILFPFFWFLLKLIDLGVIGQKREIVIDPIKTTTH